MLKTQGLSARELLASAYDCFGVGNAGGEVRFISPARVDIEDYTYPSRTKIGHMWYRAAHVVHRKGKTWAISFGAPTEDDPAALCSCDLIVISLLSNGNDKRQRCLEIVHEILNGNWFYNSFIQAMDDGRLAVGKDARFGEEVRRLLKPKIRQFVVSQNPVVLYQPSFAAVLHETILAVLETGGS